MLDWTGRLDGLAFHLSREYSIEDRGAIEILLAALIDCPRTPACRLRARFCRCNAAKSLARTFIQGGRPGKSVTSMKSNKSTTALFAVNGGLSRA